MAPANSRCNPHVDAELAYKAYEPARPEPDVQPVLRDLDPLDHQLDDPRLHGPARAWRPGGAPRRGVHVIETPRSDRLFIGLLGSACIFLARIGLVG